MSSQAYNDAFYDDQSAGSYRSAGRMLQIIDKFINAESILDVGCGVGSFLRAFSERGVGDIQGVDGDYVPRGRLMIDPARFHGHDLSTPLDLGRRFDLVVSLEVAEHLPADRAGVFVANLCRHADVVVFSAAIPGQGGTGHVNEQWPGYWRELFSQQGYAGFDPFRRLWWDDGDIEFWYRQNTILFANPAGQTAHPGLAAFARSPAGQAGVQDLVHPEAYTARLAEGAEITRAAGLIAMMDKLCADGGAFRFVRNPDGSIAVRRG